jgi:hypothetical protein
MVESIKNMCFIFKNPNEIFFKANSSGKLDKLGVFSFDRWHHVKEVHHVFPNPTGQAYFAKLTINHVSLPL